MTENTPTEFPTYEEIYGYFKEVVNSSTDKYTDETINVLNSHIDTHTNHILNLVSPLREEFLHWWKTGELISTAEINGIKLQSLVEKRRWNAGSAFGLFSELYRNPDDSQLLWILKGGDAIIDVSEEEWNKAVIEV